MSARASAALLLVSCAAAPPPTGEAGLAGDTGAAAPAGLPEGWDLQPVQACDAPGAAAWSEQGARLGPPVDARDMPIEQTAVVTRDGRRFVVIEGAGRAVAHRLDGPAEAIAAPWPVMRAARIDLMGDGDDDLVLMGQGLVVRWDWGTEREVEQVLDMGEPYIAYREVLLVDLDGDGQRDLLALIAGGEDGGGSHARWWPGRPAGLGEPRELFDPQDARWGAPFALRVMDFTGDGAPDVYLCNDFGPEQGGNWLLENDGAGGFSAAEAPDLEIVSHCMGTSVGDADGDGALDLYFGAIEEEVLLLRRGDAWVQGQRAAGLAPFAAGQMVWGSQLIDLDNDGATDLLSATSDFSTTGAKGFPLLARFGRGDGTFDDRSAELGLPAEGSARALVARDLNGDGLPDLFVSSFAAPPLLYLSEGCTEQAWLRVEGPAGTRVEVDAGGRTFVGLITGRPGFSAAMAPELHLGLGQAEEVDSVRVFPLWGPPQEARGPFPARRTLRLGP